MWSKWNAQHPSRGLYMPLLSCNSHTHVVTIYKLALGKVRISSHLKIWNSSYFSHSQLHQSVHFLMVIMYLGPIFKLSALFPFPLVAVWCVSKPKSLGEWKQQSCLCLTHSCCLWHVKCLCSHTKSRCRAGRESSSANWAVQHQVWPGQQNDAGGTQVRRSHLNPSLAPQTHCLGAMPSQSLALLGAEDDSRTLITALTVMSAQTFPKASLSDIPMRTPQCGQSREVFSATSAGKCKNTNKTLWLSLPPPQPGSGNASCCLCRINIIINIKKYYIYIRNHAEHILEFTQGWLGTKPDPHSFPQGSRWYKPHQLSGITVKTSSKLNLHQSHPTGPRMWTNCHPRTRSLHLPMDWWPGKGHL